MSSFGIDIHPVGDKKVSLDRAEILSPYFLNPTSPEQKLVKDILGDIRSYISRIDIFEDIFTPAITGQIYMRDTVSLTNLAHMIGLDQFWMQFSIQDKQSNDARKFGPYPFSIYTQLNRAPSGQGTEEYVLGIASPELISSTLRKISRAYNAKPEDIIADIVSAPYGLNSSKPFIEKETTKSKLRLVVPYMRPLDLIRLIGLHGQSSQTDNTNYLFFETLDGYYYISFQRLLELSQKDQTIPTIYVELAGQRDIGNVKNFIKAEQLEVVTGFDLMYAMQKGYFSSVTIAPDILSGVCNIEVSGTGLGTSYDARKRVNTNGRDVYPPEIGQTSPVSSRMFLVPTTQYSAANTQLTQKDKSLSDNFIAKTISGKNQELLGLQLRTIRGRVAGVPELHPGKFIDVIFPTTLNNNNITGNEFRDIASGRYVITNAKHSIIADGRNGFLYETTFEAVTDSFARA